MPKAVRETRTLILIALILPGLLLSACERKRDSRSTADTVTAAASKSSAAAEAIARPRPNRGVVRNVRIGGGYSYIEVDVGDGPVWLATAITAVSPGDRIAWNDYAVMSDFESKALNRRFERILFVGRIVKLDSESTPRRRGVVSEIMVAAGYSFIRVEENGASLWLAAPETPVDVGQAIEWSGGSLMRNFNSRSLQRVFDEIIFVGSVHLS